MSTAHLLDTASIAHFSLEPFDALTFFKGFFFGIRPL
jgi:hypothetical protein